MRYCSSDARWARTHRASGGRLRLVNKQYAVTQDPCPPAATFRKRDLLGTILSLDRKFPASSNLQRIAQSYRVVCAYHRLTTTSAGLFQRLCEASSRPPDPSVSNFHQYMPANQGLV
jgi:hypothetical protein